MGRGHIEVVSLFRGKALTNNGVSSLSNEFPMGGEGWHSMKLRFNVAITIGTGAGAIIGEALARYIKNIFLKTDRGEILCQLPGRAILKIASIRAGSPPRFDVMANASATYRIDLEIFFSDMGLIREEDTILDTRRYSSLELQITLGSISDLITTPGTATIDTVTLDCEVVRTKGLLPDQSSPIAHVYYVTRPPIDANSATEVLLDKGVADLWIKRLLTHECTSGTAGAAWSGVNADVVKDVVSIEDQNGFIIQNRIHEMIQNQNKDNYSLESVLAGVEVFDFVLDGSIQSALWVGDKSKLSLTWTNKAGVVANDLVSVAYDAIRTLKN